MPREGKEKGGTPETRVGARIKTAGAAAGVSFTGACDTYPNSLPTHALLKFAGEVSPSKQHELMEVLFRKYFHDGEYLWDKADGMDNLTAAAEEVGLDGVAARAYAEDEANQRVVADEAQRISRSGVSGVPFFFFDGEPAFSGAQPPAAFTEILDQVAASK